MSLQLLKFVIARKLFLLQFVFLFFTISVLAQTRLTVTGKITDGESALSNVSVLIKETQQGTITNEQGVFTLSVFKGQTLVISHTGFEEQSIKIGNQERLNIVLKASSQNVLNDVVVIGYGTQKKVDLTGSVSFISSKELTKRPVTDASLLLQGKVPGVQIIQGSGQPGGEGASIQIRGMGSFGASNAPLVLIDGVAGQLAGLNPEMIESISVLKDAASASIYGSRAANGVILVTTKRGDENGRLNINYHVNYAYQTPTRMPEFVNNSAEYMTMLDTALVHSRGPGSELYSQAEIDAYRNNVGNPRYPNTRWEDYIMQNGIVENHNLSLDGGKSGTVYYLGLGYLDQIGVQKGNSYKRYDLLFNLTSSLSKRVTLHTNFNVSSGNRNSSDVLLYSYASKPLRGPYMPGSNNYSSRSYAKEYNNWNPVMLMENNSDNLIVNSGTFLISANIKLLEGLNWETTGAAKTSISENKVHGSSEPMYDWHTYEYLGLSSHSIPLTVRYDKGSLLTLFSTIKYDKLFAEKHQVNALLGYSQENSKNEYLLGFRKDFPNSSIRELAAGGTDGQIATGDAAEWAIQSVLGRMNYAFDDKYLFQASFRYDGSSRFSKGNRWGFFPSASVGWRVTKEKFMADVSWISDLKIRGSWGTLGNQSIGNYPYQELYVLGTGYPFGSSVQPGAELRGLSNNKISWESTAITDFGFDFSFFKNKFYGTFDWFNKATSDILRGSQVPIFVGLAAPTVNSGAMKNTGIEILVGYKKTIGDFSFDASFNLGSYKNTLVKFGKQEYLTDRTLKEGLPWNSYYLLHCIGIFQSQEEIDKAPVHQFNPKPGDLRYEDISGPDGKPDGKIDQYDRTLMPGAFPKFDYGFNLSAKWKNFDISIFLQGSEGRKLSVSLWGYEPFFEQGRPPTFWRNAWTPENHSTTLPRLYMPGEVPAIKVSTESAGSSFWLQDASYIRLKNLQIGYNIPTHLYSKIGLLGFRVYFSGDNLYTITKFYKGGDPERLGGGRFPIYPQIAIYSFGAKINL